MRRYECHVSSMCMTYIYIYIRMIPPWPSTKACAKCVFICSTDKYIHLYSYMLVCRWNDDIYVCVSMSDAYEFGILRKSLQTDETYTQTLDTHPLPDPYDTNITSIYACIHFPFHSSPVTIAILRQNDNNHLHMYRYKGLFALNGISISIYKYEYIFYSACVWYIRQNQSNIIIISASACVFMRYNDNNNDSNE